MKTLKGIYPYANTIACMEESKLLKQFRYDILFNAAGLQSALDELNNINYFHTYRNAEAHNYNAMLDGLMGATFELMKGICPTILIFKAFALYYDIHNMKLVVKERFIGKRLDFLAMEYGNYTLATIRSAAVRESDNILENEVLTEGLFRALQTKDMYDIDFILDKAYFKTLKELAAQLESPGIADFVGEKIDLFNVSAYFQSLAAGEPEGYFAKAFSDQGSCPLSEWMEYIDAGPGVVERFPLWQKYRPVWVVAESRRQIFSELDVLIDNYLIEKTIACKYAAFGIEPICAYFFNKFMEIKNVRILLTGKEKYYSISEIKKRMRKPYEL
jgi:V/A-type H+-transporting ATPase subunit C